MSVIEETVKCPKCKKSEIIDIDKNDYIVWMFVYNNEKSQIQTYYHRWCFNGCNECKTVNGHRKDCLFKDIKI